MMNQYPLEIKFASLRRRVRWLALLHGASWVVAAVLGAVIPLGMADYLVRFQDRGLRVICWLVLLGAAGWTCYRFLVLAALARLRDVDLARCLERRFPRLGDRLLSAVEFLRQADDDPLAGSPALRRAVISQAVAETERLRFADALDPRPARRAAAVSMLILMFAAILVLLDPSSSQIAIARLGNPFGNVAWPQRNHLLLRNEVSRVYWGKAFELEVIAAEDTELPETVKIYYRFEDEDGTLSEESSAMQPSGDAVVARRENVTRPFSYRVEGGDDRSMPWIDVEVVTPPAVASVSIQLIPPPYTGWPPQRTDRHVRALEGAEMRIAAESTKPLQSAVFCIDDGQKSAGVISGDGFSITAPGPGMPPIVLNKSGSYWFELTDHQGLAGGSDLPWEIQVVPDSPPAVSIEKPTADLFVTPNAVVPLRVEVKDDLVVHEVALVFSRSNQPERELSQFLSGKNGTVPLTEPIVLPLYQGPDRVLPQSTGPPAAAADSNDRRVIEYRWELQGLRLSPGAKGVFYVTASDYKPQSAVSKQMRLTIVTPEQLQDRLSGRQTLIRGELQRVLKLQEGARDQVAQLLKNLQAAGSSLTKANLDSLQAAELNQRQVANALTSREEGLPAYLESLLAEMDNNNIQSPEIRGPMHTLLNRIDELGRADLPALAGDLAAAKRSAQIQIQEQSRPAPPGKDVVDPLIRSQDIQEKVLSALRPFLADMDRWDNYRRVVHQFDQLLADQRAAAEDAVQLGPNSQGKRITELTERQLADLKNLAERQLELGRRLDRAEQEMQQTAVELRQSIPAAAQTMSAALGEALRRAISARMQSAGADVRENRLGQAVPAQRQIVQDLQAVLDLLADRRRSGSAGADENSARLKQAVADLYRRQQELFDGTRQYENLRGKTGQLPRSDAAGVKDLAGRQKSLQGETDRLGKDVPTAGEFQAALTGAADRMGAAAVLLDELNTGTAAQQAEKDALAQLESLMESVRSQPNWQPGEVNKQSPGDVSQVPKDGSRPVDQSNASQAGKPGEKSNPKSTASGNPSPTSGQNEPPDMAQVLGAAEHLWGALPDRARQQILELKADDFVPKYQGLIEQYYRRLSEEK
jgi:hypothetical protein